MAIVDDYAAIAQAMKALKGETEDDTYYCAHCEGGGWECYGIGVGDPHFRECRACHNPKGLPSP